MAPMPVVFASTPHASTKADYIMAVWSAYPNWAQPVDQIYFVDIQSIVVEITVVEILTQFG